VLTAATEAWGLAVRRAGVIRELAAQRGVGLEFAGPAASQLGVSRRQARRLRQGGPRAVMTLGELQRWLALAVACYHGKVHESLGRALAAEGERV
jgi:hypothetical protein